ncbi:MAG: hypothetical protein E7411_00280 [Ruminococcaceae bacterium]|nr:hypothetical protein [Oscillospiraceae bacterium]
MKRILSLLLSVTVILSAFSFVLPAYASGEEALIDYLYYDDFSTTDKMTNYFTSYNPTVKIWDAEANAMADAYKSNFSLTDNTLKVTNTTTGGVTRVGFRTPTPVDKPKLIISLDVKPNFTTTAGYGFGSRDLYGSGTFHILDKGNITAHTAGTAQNTGATYAKGEWINITLVYDNDNTKNNNRDIYVNGVNCGAYTNPSASWQYADKGFVEFLPQFYSKAGDSVQLDNIEVYAYPTELKYELESATVSEVKINFNMIPDSTTLIPANFIVKEGNTTITPANVTLSKENERQAVLTFNEALIPGTVYTVSAQNVTAGASKTDDVSDTIALASSPELSFKVAPAKVEWKETNEFWCYNYENLTPVTGLGKDEAANGVYEFGTGGLYNIEEVDGQKALTMQQNSTSATDTYAFIRPNKSNYASVDAYAVEMKVKVDFSKNPENAMFDARSNPGYGLKFTAMHNGGIYTDDGLTDSIGIYKDGEWITLKNVYYNSPVNIDGTDYLRRDIYINGQFAKTVYDDWNAYKGFIDGQTWHSYFRFRVRDRYSKINTEGKVYIDYIRIYKTSDSFAAKLTAVENVDTSFVNVQFNSTPVLSDLTDKIYIADENGVKVSDIAVPEFVNEFNADGYAAKVNLWFANGLELGKTYKLCIDGISDIAGNKLYQEESFTTKAAPEAEGLTLSGGIATVTVNEYTEPLTLIVAGYEVTDGVEKMVKVVEKTITATGTFSTEEAVEADVVKAFLWKGTKPVVSAAQ